MTHCSKFCKGANNTNTGINCVLGFTHNPKTQEATFNLIKNGGKNSICHNNPWKYHQDRIAKIKGQR